MSDLTPEDRRLLDLVRDAHEPTGADAARVRGRLVAALGAGTGLTLATAGTAAGSAAAGTSATLAVAKILGVVALVAVIGSGGVVAYRETRAPRPVAVTTQTSRAIGPVSAASFGPANAPFLPLSRPTVLASPPTDPAPDPSAPHADDTRAAQLSPRVVGSARAPVAAREDRPAPAPAPSPDRPGSEASAIESTATIPAVAAPTTVEAEMKLVGAGVSALHAGNPTGALALFDAHARAYPNGVLAEERAAERVFALCGVGRVGEARSAAADFLRDRPRSPLAARVRASCAAPANP